eukprot:31413-Pelagococcus_subviridis.AAC.4
MFSFSFPRGAAPATPPAPAAPLAPASSASAFARARDFGLTASTDASCAFWKYPPPSAETAVFSSASTRGSWDSTDAIACAGKPIDAIIKASVLRRRTRVDPGTSHSRCPSPSPSSPLSSSSLPWRTVGSSIPLHTRTSPHSAAPPGSLHPARFDNDNTRVIATASPEDTAACAAA